ncbi:expressed protein [Phakopsora pachyrhizi]|uniref:Expressed protein n=1 Tax=Phakopsora pachyrhizi TaxID=170000 RepID=A0AAV0BGT3_PHAPC|nr:expressed protein [Phakopsora pachyrhizi]
MKRTHKNTMFSPKIDSSYAYDFMNSHKRSWSLSEECDSEAYQTSEGAASLTNFSQGQRKRQLLLSPESPDSMASYSSGNQMVLLPEDPFSPGCPKNSIPWHEALDEVALLAAIEEKAQTYASGGSFDFISPYLYTLTCPTVPSSSFSPPEEIQNHPSNQAKPFKCPFCPKSFTRNYDLTRHKSSHQDDRQHTCRKCGRSFNRRDALSRHDLARGCSQTDKLGEIHQDHSHGLVKAR